MFRQTMGAFVLCLVTLTGVLWLTQALKELGLITSGGQTFLLFLQFTMLSLPGMMIVITPITYFIGCIYTLNRMNNDSELVIISASGASRWIIMRPFLFGAAVVTLMLYVASLYLVPLAWRDLRVLITEVRTDVLSTILNEGEFSAPETNLVFHVRQRAPDGSLKGLLVHDSRDPLTEFTYLAREARLITQDDDAVLVMQTGSVQQQRRETTSEPFGEISIVTFDRYLLDLSRFSVDRTLPSLKPRERSMTELLFPAADDPRYLTAPGKFVSELNERLAGPLYPLAYTMIALAAVGFARSNREKRIFGILIATVAVVLVRLGGFAAVNISATVPAVSALVYVFPVGGFVVALLVATGWIRNSRLALLSGRIADAGISLGMALLEEMRRWGLRRRTAP